MPRLITILVPKEGGMKIAMKLIGEIVLMEANLRKKVRDHMLRTHDTGLMNEGDMMERAGEYSVLEMARKQGGVNVGQAFEAADLVGKY